jgi:predicted MFS family arabinose efflux permease
VIVQRADWRWIFWTLTIVCAINTAAGFVFLRETYAPVLLEKRKQQLEQEPSGHPNKYRVEGQDERPVGLQLRRSLTRPLRILMQPIVLVMSTYQALIFGTTFSIYTNMQPIYGDNYGFSTEKVGLLYLGPGLGFLTAVWFLVPRIDSVYNNLASRNGGKAKPEYRLPLANIGAVFIPISLFWFAWTVELHAHWFASIAATYFYGIGQVMILNTCQNYYIDSFEKYAASAIAAGAAFRSILGGVTPLFAPAVFEKLGYGWGVSVFAFLAVIIAPAPLVFYRYGDKIRERFWIDLDN